MVFISGFKRRFMKIKILLLSIIVMVFIGCSSTKSMSCNACGDEGMRVDTHNKILFTHVIEVENDCSLCSKDGSKVFINGAGYGQNGALKCCLEKNMIDTNIGLKKVYFHRFTDERKSARSIVYTRKNGTQTVFNSNPRLEVLFYMFLEHELKSRGIVVVDTQTSPYTYRLDFKFYGLKGDYDRSAEYLSGSINGEFSLSNINLKRQKKINARQVVEKLKASDSDDFDFFVALLVKQLAINVADEISKL